MILEKNLEICEIKIKVLKEREKEEVWKDGKWRKPLEKSSCNLMQSLCSSNTFLQTAP